MRQLCRLAAGTASASSHGRPLQCFRPVYPGEGRTRDTRSPTRYIVAQPVPSHTPQLRVHVSPTRYQRFAPCGLCRRPSRRLTGHSAHCCPVSPVPQTMTLRLSH